MTMRRNFVPVPTDETLCENCNAPYVTHVGEAQACPGELSNPELKVLALGYVNDVRVAYGKEPLVEFVPICVNEDNDCVIEALREASGRSLDWNDFDGEIHWLGTWNDWTALDSYRFHVAWGTRQEVRSDRSADVDVEIPVDLAHFAFKVSEGEYPECEIDIDDLDVNRPGWTPPVKEVKDGQED